LARGKDRRGDARPGGSERHAAAHAAGPLRARGVVPGGPEPDLLVPPGSGSRRRAAPGDVIPRDPTHRGGRSVARGAPRPALCRRGARVTVSLGPTIRRPTREAGGSSRVLSASAASGAEPREHPAPRSGGALLARRA